MTKRIGIFLGYPPEVSLRKEGISRLLGFIMKAAVRDGRVQLVVACPKWLEPKVLELFEDQKIDPHQVEMLTTSSVPLVISFHQNLRGFIAGTQKVLKDFQRWRFQMRDKIKQLFTPSAGGGATVPTSAGLTGVAAVVFSWLASPSLVVFLLWSLPMMLLFTLLALSAMVFVVPVVMVRKTVVWLFGALKFAKKTWLRQLLVGPASLLQRNQLVMTVYDGVRQFEFERLIARINKRRDVVAWYVPTLFWPEAVGIHAPKVVMVPDLVILQYPSFFTHEAFKKTYHRMMETLWKADVFTCYSEYIRDVHLAKMSGIDASRTEVIRHGRIELMSYLLPSQGEAGGEAENVSSEAIRMAALHLVCAWQRQRQKTNIWLRSIDFAAVPFVFYSSQYRPYKNMLSLIRALPLVHKHYPELRLVLTADVRSIPEVWSQIEVLHLEPFVVSAYDIPTRLLAAFNHLARLSVNPTLFEGGYPFTFSEAYSVGTPSVISNIDIVREVVKDPELLAEMCFDPFSVESIADRICYGLAHRDHLYERQAAIYNNMRSWDDAAQHYVDYILSYEAKTSAKAA